MRGATALSADRLPPAAEVKTAPPDVRDALFAPLAGRTFAFEITTCAAGVVAGTHALVAKSEELGIGIEWLAADGTRLEAGARLFRACGDAWQVARAEEQLIGLVAKASGVATAAARLVAIAGARTRVVCGAWKKVPPPIRPELREAIVTGGAQARILDRPFVYLDKNYVRMLGGVTPSVRQARRLSDRAVVVQLRGELDGITREAEAAAAAGAAVLMVDTGNVADLVAVARQRSAGQLPGGIVLGFGGDVDHARLAAVVEAGADVVDVGRAIIDAPLLDLRLDVR